MTEDSRSKARELLAEFDKLLSGLLEVFEKLEDLQEEEADSSTRDATAEANLADACDRLEEMCVTGYSARHFIKAAGKWKAEQ